MRTSTESERETDLVLSSITRAEDSDQEQAQRLLEKDGSHAQYKKHHGRSLRWKWLVALGVLLLLGGIIAVLLFSITRQTTTAETEGNLIPHDDEIPASSEDGSISLGRSDDYILDPTWDFKAAPMRREYHWAISDETANPDGVYRPMLLINKEFPGPLVEVNEGDTIVVHVHNQAKNATSIHWHGMYQRGTNWMDGTTGVTQCPIAPGTNFTYEFKVEEQAGTYWYHAHHGAQTSDGLFGPLIVHSKEEKVVQKVVYASDRVVMVQDYYHDLSDGLLLRYLEPDNENAEPVPDGALINGQNIRNCTTLSHRKCDATNASLPIFNLAPNQNHRLRFINVGAFAEFQIRIDEHQFAITEVDGTDIWPTYFHRLSINPAQRYSIVVSANNTERDSFWLRARMVTHCFAKPNSDLDPEARAIIRYHDPSSPTSIFKQRSLPDSADWPETIELQCHDHNTTSLTPVIPVSAPSRPDASFYLRSNFMIGAHRLSRGFFNSSSFHPQIESPVLHRLVTGLSTPATSINFTRLTAPPPPPTTFYIYAPEPMPPLQSDGNIGVNREAYDPSTELVLQTHTSPSTIDLIFANFDDGAHPLHLHGHKFFILGSGAGDPPPSLLLHHNTETLLEEPTLNLNLDLTNPLRRDTATVPGFGWIHIRVTLDNPGAWLLHCHIAWHFEAGMGMVLVVGAGDLEQDVKDGKHGWVDAVERGERMCRLPGIERGRRPDDRIWDHA